MFHLPGDTQSNKTISATLPRNIMRNEVLMMAFLYVLQQSPLAPIRAANVLCFARPDISNVARITSERSNVVDEKKKQKCIETIGWQKTTHIQIVYFDHSTTRFLHSIECVIWFDFFFCRLYFSFSLCMATWNFICRYNTVYFVFVFVFVFRILALTQIQLKWWVNVFHTQCNTFYGTLAFRWIK